MPVVNLQPADYSCTVGGEQMDLLSLDIMLEANAPPQISGVAIPSSEIEKGVVKADSAGKFWNGFNKADGKIGTESVDLSISRIGPDGDVNFNASGWVLADVSMSVSAQANGQGLAMAFTALHPACLLNKYPFNLGAVSIDPHYSDVKDGNLLDVIASAIEVYADKASPVTKKQYAYKLVKEGVGKLKEYLDCSGLDISRLRSLFEGVADPKGVVDGFKKYVLSAVAHGGENANMYSLVCQQFANALSVRLCVDPSDISAKKLRLRPSIPYTSDTVKLKLDDIESMSGGAGQWLRLTGVTTYTTLPTGLFWNCTHELDEDPLVPSAYCSVIDKNTSSQLLNVAMPDWYTAVLEHCTTPYWNSPQEVSAPADFDVQNEACRKSASRVLTQHLLDAYRITNSLVVSKSFSLKDSDGKLLVPGVTCRIGGSSGLLFHIASVRHSLNVNNQTARTVVSGNFVRGTDFKLEVDGLESQTLISNGYSANRNYIWG